MFHEVKDIEQDVEALCASADVAEERVNAVVPLQQRVAMSESLLGFVVGGDGHHVKPV